jgi:hypothetical protein
MRSFILALFANYNYNAQVKEDKMGGVCDMHGSVENSHRVSVGKPEGRKLLGRPKRRIILKWILEK